MKKFFSFLFKPWLLTLVLAIILALIIWYIGPIIAVGSFKPFAAEWVRLI